VHCLHKASGKKHSGRVVGVNRKKDLYEVEFNNPKYGVETAVPRSKLTALHVPSNSVRPTHKILDSYRVEAPKSSSPAPSRKLLPTMSEGKKSASVSGSGQSGSKGSHRSEGYKANGTIGSNATRSVASSDGESSTPSSVTPRRGTGTVESSTAGGSHGEEANWQDALLQDAKYGNHHTPNKINHARLHSKSSRSMIVPGTSANAADNHPYMLPLPVVGRQGAPLPPLQSLASLTSADAAPPSPLTPVYRSMLSKGNNTMARSVSRVASRNFITRKQSSIAATAEAGATPYRDSVSSAGFRLSSKSFIMQKNLSSVSATPVQEDDKDDFFSEFYSGPFDDQDDDDYPEERSDRDSRRMKSATLIARQQNKISRQGSSASTASMYGNSGSKVSTVLRGSASRRNMV